MASPERPNNHSSSQTRQEHVAALADIDRQLEVTDANENPIERLFKREQLLEQRDQLEANPAEGASTPK